VASTLPTASSAEPVLVLWEKRHALRQQLFDATCEADAAADSMPEWARPGLQMLEHDGTLTGAHVGWPAIHGMKPRNRKLGPERTCPRAGRLSDYGMMGILWAQGEKHENAWDILPS
jgi:hypothetical protein